METLLDIMRQSLVRAARRSWSRPVTAVLGPSGAEIPGPDVEQSTDSERPSRDGGVPAAESDPILPSSQAAAHRRIAQQHICRRQYGRAQRELEAALACDPGSPAQEDLAALRGVRRYRRLADRQPSNAIAHLELGRCLLELDLAEEALAELREAARLAPSLAEPHILMAVEHLFSSRRAEAEEEYALAVEREPSLPPLSRLLDNLHANSSPGERIA